MAQYTGRVDDYLQATNGSLEVATDHRVISLYDPETNEVEYIRIDVSDKGGKEVDKTIDKTNAAIDAAQADMRKLLDKIKESGGGTVLKRRPKSTAKKADAPAATPSADSAQASAHDTPSQDTPATVAYQQTGAAAH